MNKKLVRGVLRLMIALQFTLVLSGCWERNELNEIAFVLGIGIDKAEKGYTVSMQVVIPSAISSQTNGGGGGSGVPVVVYKFTVPTFYDALRKLNLDSSRSSYLGHIRVLVIGEELARTGVGEILDVFKRSREPRMDFYVMVARDTTASNVLNVLTPMDKLPANKLFSSLDNSYKDSAKTVAVTLDDFIENLLSEGENPVLTGVKIIGDPKDGEDKSNVERTMPKARLEYHTVAVFKKDKLIGWLTEGETIGYNYINDKVTAHSGPIAGEDGKPIVIEAIQATTKRKVKIINGEPHIYLSVKTLCNIEEVQSVENLESESTIKRLEKETEERIIERMQKTVEHVNDRFNVDIMGFGQSIYHASPKAWAKLQQQKGDDYLKSLPIHYKASAVINRVGLTDNSFLEKIKE
ncbi:Ger(x)C family spore germination protein [Paenibacillus sp. FSL R7-0048]|jgi:spore germination protein KC|uniref:Ger(x)C family spore germination protein n=1 Tax=Paenibacillus TaxID=44249 RepID=UPI00096F4887|nr:MULTISPECIES: Ger(x)C family spore germination protein [Paenibacillus]MDH6425782.1 spore germination protein KC [Paenibacillus sp. PastH-4]MDH6441803.1 spore germination protein KC [Paenibacillus sp. PastF-4]MDH6527482.1 spore germination protein KC [Paenibacillus sp. PastH-3]OMC65108.1 spore gernimation protein GerC [Paenibacillus odorifer]OMC79783.1 spore gernimation protein GerC [Paenibacillus odorifer]